MCKGLEFLLIGNEEYKIEASIKAFLEGNPLNEILNLTIIFQELDIFSKNPNWVRWLKFA